MSAIRNEQEQKLLELNSPPVALNRQPQVVHGRPFHAAEPAAVQQVDDDGYRSQERTPDQKRAQEGKHGQDRVPWRTAARPDSCRACRK